MKNRIRLWLVLPLTVAILLAGCGGYQAPAPAPEEKPAQKPPATEERVALNLEMKNIAFSPAAIEVDVGQGVKIVNRDSIPHTFTAQNPQTGQVVVDKRLNALEGISFLFDTKGVWKVWCTIHSDGTSSNPATSGMRGKVGVGVAVTEEGETGGGRYQY